MATLTIPPHRKSKQSSEQPLVSVSEKWLRAIVSADEITEVFVKGAVSGSTSFNLIGFYDSLHLGKLAADVAAYSGVAKGVYFRINPVKRSLLSRAPNQLLPTSKVRSGTSDDITRRRLLMIDIDANRPTGTNATDDEKLQAQRLRDAVIEFLKEQGWPGPAYVDSGNGYCLFYRVDLPVEDNGLVRGVLKLLDRTLSTNRAHIDAGVHDPARLARLPGTMNCKGEHAVDRPQRPCRLLRLPIKGLQNVPRELLECAVTNPEASAVDTEATVATANPDVVSRARAYVAKMPPAVAASGGDPATYTVACRLVIGFGLSPEQAMPLMLEYNERCQPPWTAEALRRKLDKADQQARQTGVRGNLLGADSKTTELPLLSGAAFVGFIPDFGDASTADVLAPLSRFVGKQHDWIEYFCTWQKLVDMVAIPDVLLRQCYYGAAYPNNWRREFRKWLGGMTLEEAIEGYFCMSGICVLHGAGNPHRHFSGSDWDRGILEAFASQGQYLRKYLLYDQQHSNLRQEMRSQRKIIKVYWPALIFGQAKMIDWTTGQQRLLVGLAAELTLGRRVSKNSIPRGEVVQDSLVVGPANKEQLVRCPLLDPNMAYVTFGGNGPSGRRGRGYQITGRTNRGWLYRAGYPDCRRVRPQTRCKVLGQFLRNLRRLAGDLDLIVVGYHHRHRTKWKDLEELVHCLKSGSGLDWLDECTLRIYTPSDWLVRWRHFFSQRLGFRWIPAAPSDEGTHPAREVPGDERQVTGGHQIAKLLDCLGWTQEQLAEEISELLGKRVSRRRVIRHCQETSHNEEFLSAVEEIRRRHGIDLTSTD